MHQYIELRGYQVQTYYFNLTEELILGKIDGLDYILSKSATHNSCKWGSPIAS